MAFHWALAAKRKRSEAGLPMALPRPRDFETIFIEIGRLACQEHYSVGRSTVNRWLDECGRERLVAARAEHVGRFSPLARNWREPVRATFLEALADGMTVDASARKAGISPHCAYEWRRRNSEFAAAWDAKVKENRGLTRAEMTIILKRSFAANERVNLALVRRAAQHLREVRNGAWIVSQAPDGNWRVGTRLCSPSELLELAKSKGFQA